MIWTNGFFSRMKISILFMQKTGRRIFHARLIPLVTYILLYDNLFVGTVVPLIFVVVTFAVFIILIT